MIPNEIFGKQFLENVIDASEDTIFVFNPQTGKPIMWNKAFRDISGYNDDEILSLKAPDSYYSVEDLRKAKVASKKVLKNGKTSVEMKLITKNGHKILYEYWGTSLQGPDGNMLIVSVGRNIAEREKIKDILRESEEKFRAITEQSFMSILVLQDGLIKYFNDRVLQRTGYSRKEIENWAPYEFLKTIHPEDKEFVLEQVKKKQAGEKDTVPQYRYRLITKNKEVRWIENFSQTITYKGKPADLVTSIDITDKIDTEKKLKESEVKYRTLFNDAPFAIILFDIQGIILDCNDGTSKITGYSKEELIGNDFRSFNFYVDIESANLDERVSQTSSGKIPKPRKLQLYRKDGSKFWARSHIEFIQIRDNTLIQAFIHDITEQKESEQRRINSQKELEKSYQKLRELENIISRSPGVLFLWQNSEGWPVEFVSENVNQFGYTRENFYSGEVVYEEIIHPDDLEKVAEEVKIHSNEDINEFVQEYRIITKSGEVKWLDDRTWIRRDSEGNITHFQGIVIDITDRKKTEQMLRESERKYQILAKVSPVGIFNTDIKGDCLYVNEQWCEIAGMLPIEAMGTGWSNAIHPDDRERVFKEWYDAAEKNKTFRSEYRFKRPDGRITWVIGQAIPSEDDFGKLNGYVGTITDITERKINEKKILDIARFPSENPNPVLRVNKEKIIYINNAGKEFFELKQGNQVPNILQEGVHRALSNMEINIFEIEINERIYSFDITPIKEVGYVNVYGRDITKRKRAEQKLKESEEKYRDAFNTANFYKDLFAHDMSNILQVINSSAELISFNLGESEKSKQIENISDIIKKQVDRGSKLISNVRTLTELDGTDITKKFINLHETINNAIKNVEKAYDDRIIKINIDSIGEELIVNANDLLQHVFENVIINSIKYNENSTVNLNIKISKDQIEKNEYFKIQFIDNGIGIPDDRKEIIFKPGNRELKGSKGMGLGLSLVNKILKIFNGKIWVEDRFKGDYKKGSNFIILIPKLK